MPFARLALGLELGRWGRAGRVARLWWRDDDAREPTPELERLLALAARSDAPLALAVIPDAEPARLAPLLGKHPQVSVLQHGVHHRNRRRGPVAGEFPPEMSREEIAGEVRTGWARLQDLPGAIAVFAPPWNDVHPALPGALRLCGHRGFSAWGEISAAARPFRIDAHLDLMRWRPAARFRGEAGMWLALRRALAERRRAGRWEAPIGVLTHHLVHDEAAWAFLRRLLDWTRQRPELAWTDAATLFPEAGETSG